MSNPPLPESTDDPPKSPAMRLAARFKAPNIDEKPPPPPYLVATKPNAPTRSEVVIPLGITGMLAATGGTGKTWALLQLGASIAAGRQWFDFTVKRGRVLYIGGEESTALLSERLWHIAEDWSDAERIGLKTNLRILSWDDDDSEGFTPTFISRNESNSEWQASESVVDLSAALREAPGAPWRLIVIDPASRFAGDSEKDSSAATAFLEAVRAIARRANKDSDEIDPTIIVAHHTRKPAKDAHKALWLPKDAARGSSGLVDAARFLLTMKAIPPSAVPGSDDDLRSADDDPTGSPYCTLQVAKSNHGTEAGITRRVLKRADNGVLERATCGEAGEPVNACDIGKLADKPDKPSKPKNQSKESDPYAEFYK